MKQRVELNWIELSTSNLRLHSHVQVDRLSLILELVEDQGELEQLHEGCYVQNMYLYGARYDGKVLTEPEGGEEEEEELWQHLGMVKLVPGLTSKMGGAGVVKIPLHAKWGQAQGWAIAGVFLRWKTTFEKRKTTF